MSKGTYVLQTAGDEYRVAQLDNIDDLFVEQNPETLQWTPNTDVMAASFGTSLVYDNFTTAWDYAEKLDNQRPTDVGPSVLRQFASLKWSDIKKEEK